jgi:hypothetical protein
MPSRLKPSRLTSVIVIAFTMTLSALWSLHTESQNISVKYSKFEWRQPLSLAGSFPMLISTIHWQFDYEATEQALLAIKANEVGDLILNANTAKILKKAVSKLPSKMNTAELQRVEFLVAEGLPGKAGQQLATVMTNFYHFKQATDIADASTNAKQNKQSKALSFQQSILRQKRYLGEHTSKQLFGKKNALNNYLYARKRINEDTNLNQVQKQDQLTTLQARFKAHDQ